MSSPRNVPLTARSVLASVLLGTDPPWLPTALLVRTASLFGIEEGAVRTALSRMVAAGEAVSEDGGYRLAGRLVVRQQRQEASRLAVVRPWDGTWELASVQGEARRAATDRSALRAALATMRLVELREGLWGRPDNLDQERSPEAAEVVDQWCLTWQGARPTTSPRIERLWDIAGWTEEAEALRDRMAELLRPLVEGDVHPLAEGFVVSAAVLRLLQADPLLPPELLSRRWPGDALRTDYDVYDAAYRLTLRRWFAAF